MRQLFREFSRDSLHSDKKYILRMVMELYLDTSDVVAVKALSR
ncbi:TPA: fructose-6-phosphate aldolase, partial [Escherichia coli]|nr:fructose-6-phosphate aldolase [Escherichia coli]